MKKKIDYFKRVVGVFGIYTANERGNTWITKTENILIDEDVRHEYLHLCYFIFTFSTSFRNGNESVRRVKGKVKILF